MNMYMYVCMHLACDVPLRLPIMAWRLLAFMSTFDVRSLRLSSLVPCCLRSRAIVFRPQPSSDFDRILLMLLNT